MAQIEAEIIPLGGKYYGTDIRLETDDGREAYITVWVNKVSDYKPSERELEGWDEERDGPYEICDDHYETKTGFEISKCIVEAINKRSDF